jgi:hypothetical protein
VPVAVVPVGRIVALYEWTGRSRSTAIAPVGPASEALNA